MEDDDDDERRGGGHYIHNNNNIVCPCCGVQTHRRCDIGRLKPISNENVNHGSCRLCDHILMKGAGSSALMFQSWSLQTVEAYLDSYNDPSSTTTTTTTMTAVTEELQQEICFGNELKDLYQQQVDTDLIFRIGGSACNTTITTTIIKAHRCIVMARSKGLAQIIEAAIVAATAAANIHRAAFNNGNDNDNDDELVIDLTTDSRFGADPRLLELAVELCYGFTTATAAATASTTANTIDHNNNNNNNNNNNRWGQDLLWKLGTDFVPDTRTYRADLLALLHQRFCSRHLQNNNITLSGNIQIIGRNYNYNNHDDNDDDEWVLSAHSAILCAHSQYARALLTHGWTIPKSSECGSKLLILDASHFSRHVMEELLHACYTNTMPCLDYSQWFNTTTTTTTTTTNHHHHSHHSHHHHHSQQQQQQQQQRPTLDFFFQLYDCACFLGMDAISRLVSKSILSRFGMDYPAEIIDFAERVESTVFVNQWIDFMCLEAAYIFKSIMMKPSSSSSSCIHKKMANCLKFHQLQALLLSDNLELPEEEILGLVLQWMDNYHHHHHAKGKSDNDNEIYHDHDATGSGDSNNNNNSARRHSQEVQMLLKHIRLPLVPVGTSQMRDAVRKGLVTRQDVEQFYLYQTERRRRGGYDIDNDDIDIDIDIDIDDINNEERYFSRSSSELSQTPFCFVQHLRKNEFNRSHLQYQRQSLLHRSLGD